MGQFTAHRNQNPRTRTAVPYLLDVQADLLDALDTRVVAPLYASDHIGGSIVDRLMPVLDVDGEPHVMVTPQIAGILRRELGPPAADLSQSRDEIVAALDLLITGI